MAREATIARGGYSNPQNAISNRTLAYEKREDYRHESTYLTNAISNRSDDLIRRYNQGYGPHDNNVRRIRRAEQNMRRRVNQ